MITAEEIIKEINETVTPFEFKLNIDYINHDFIKTIGKDYILAVNEKMSEIAKILEKYNIHTTIIFDTDNDEARPIFWYIDEEIPDELNKLMDDLIDKLIDALYNPDNLNIDYYLLQLCFNTVFFDLEDKTIEDLEYVEIN